MAKEIVHDPVGDLNHPDETNDTDPLPELRSVEEQAKEVAKVQHVGVVEGLEVSPAPDDWEGADEHDGEDDHESHSWGIRLTTHHAKHVGLHGEDPLGVRPWSGLPRAGLAHEAAVVVDHVEADAIRNIEGSQRTELGTGIVSFHHEAARRRFVHIKYDAFPVVLSPVFVGQLDKLDGVRLDVDGKVEEMHDGVKGPKEEDHDANQFVEINVVVQRQYGGQAKPPEYCDGVPEDENQHQDRVEQQESATSSREEIERVGWQPIEHWEVSEVVSTVYKEYGIYQHDDEDGGVEAFVVAPVVFRQISLR